MKLQFKSSIYTPVYERHLENLKALKRHDREAIAEFCSEIWEYARYDSEFMLYYSTNLAIVVLKVARPWNRAQYSPAINMPRPRRT